MLKPPTASDKAKQHKVTIVDTIARAPRGPAASVAGKGSTIRKITPAQRIAEFPGQGFCLDLGNKALVRCEPCNASYGTVLQSLTQHLASKSRKAKLAIWLEEKPKENALQYKKSQCHF